MVVTYLDLVKAVDSVPYPDQSAYKTSVLEQSYVFLAHNGTPLGRILDSVADALSGEPEFVVDTTARTVQLTPADFITRNQVIASLAARWRAERRYAVLLGWRNELYTVYNPTSKAYLLIERAAAALFGVVTYGVHIVGYIPPNKLAGQPFRFWVPTRSPTKPTFPGMLDNTVAGGLGYPYGVLDTAIKECGEEAGLSEDYSESHLQPAGAVTYCYRHEYEDGLNLFQPEVEYVYDLEMSEDTVPKPTDDEVAEFRLMTADEVHAELVAGHFKPNTALVQIDFMIRHGIITPENEPNYLELLALMHRRMEYPTR